ncbi:MAG: hypothetical protein IH953_04680 [Chloroflexi bacterium]|nr:hypothetical protein [Chloroflexota bacterium]
MIDLLKKVWPLVLWIIAIALHIGAGISEVEWARTGRGVSWGFEPVYRRDTVLDYIVISAIEVLAFYIILRDWFRKRVWLGTFIALPIFCYLVSFFVRSIQDPPRPLDTFHKSWVFGLFLFLVTALGVSAIRRIALRLQKKGEPGA